MTIILVGRVHDKRAPGLVSSESPLGCHRLQEHCLPLSPSHDHIPRFPLANSPHTCTPPFLVPRYGSLCRPWESRASAGAQKTLGPNSQDTECMRPRTFIVFATDVAHAKNVDRYSASSTPKSPHAGRSSPSCKSSCITR